ncbi:DNA polymerase [Vibrio phage vB_VpaM_sm033]|nr:DNA polymerase [Vibrio phage vB_VpaM_sm033]
MSTPREIQRHCMFTLYAKNQDSRTEDAVIIKERLRCKETGREKPHLRLATNVQRPYWLSKKEVQKQHKQKREFEFEYNLEKRECTQAELPMRVAQAIGFRGGFQPLSKSCRSPYIYGTDISVTVLEKNRLDKLNAANNGSWAPDFSVAVMDFETNVHSDDEEIVSGAVSMKDKAVIVISKDFVEGIQDVEERVLQMCHKYLADDIEKRKMKIKVHVVDNDFEVCKRLMFYTHQWKPDLLAFWNMNFDIKKMIQSCERHGKDPAFIFSDPSIPRQYHHFKYREDAVNRVTASGKKMNKDPSEAWHVVECPASFYIIDAMCVFRMLRVIEGKRHSYALDPILESELGIRKLEIPEVDGNHNLNWHKVMQLTKKIEYLVYNLFDCISVEMLDEKTNDLSKKIGLYADGSDLGSLSSNPKRLANAIHLFLVERGKVLCSTADDMTEEFDKFVLDKKDWIVTLANELADESGIALYRELPDLLTRAAVGVADIDITSGYPNAQFIANVSKSTTLAEVCSISGLNKNQIKQLSVDLMATPANAYEICTRVLKMPHFEDVLALYDAANDDTAEEKKAA